MAGVYIRISVFDEGVSLREQTPTRIDLTLRPADLLDPEAMEHAIDGARRALADEIARRVAAQKKP